MNVGDEDVMSGFATLLPGAEGDEEEGAAGEAAANPHHTTLHLACPSVAADKPPPFPLSTQT